MNAIGSTTSQGHGHHHHHHHHGQNGQNNQNWMNAMNGGQYGNNGMNSMNAMNCMAGMNGQAVGQSAVGMPALSFAPTMPSTPWSQQQTGMPSAAALADQVFGPTL